MKDKGGIEVTGRRGRRRRKLLDDLKDRRGYSHLKEEGLNRSTWRARFGRDFGLVVIQTAKWKLLSNFLTYIYIYIYIYIYKILHFSFYSKQRAWLPVTITALNGKLTSTTLYSCKKYVTPFQHSFVQRRAILLLVPFGHHTCPKLLSDKQAEVWKNCGNVRKSNTVRR